MNREIKFRAWDNINKKWLLGYDLPRSGGFSMHGECMMFGEYQQVLSQFPLKLLDELKIMQFTGLKDANGTDIYEGDIISPIEVDEKYKSVNYPIEWDNNTARFAYRYGQDEWKVLNIDQSFMEQCNMKVIGNIHQNPELL